MGHLDVVQALLTAGAAKAEAEEAGAMPLSTASEMGHVGIVQALLTAGAAKDQAEERGVTHFISLQTRAMLTLSRCS